MKGFIFGFITFEGVNESYDLRGKQTVVLPINSAGKRPNVSGLNPSFFASLRTSLLCETNGILLTSTFWNSNKLSFYTNSNSSAMNKPNT